MSRKIESLQAWAVVVKKFDGESLEIDLDKLFYYEDSAEEYLSKNEIVGRIMPILITPITTRRVLREKKGGRG